MRLPERTAGAEQALDVAYDLVAETGSTDANEVCAGDTEKGEHFHEHAGQPVVLMNYPG